MVFSSIIFLFLFLPLLLFLYYIMPDIRCKNVCLLFASLFFYVWGEPKYVIVMIGSIIMNWLIGELVGWSQYSASKSVCTLVTGGGYF